MADPHPIEDDDTPRIVLPTPGGRRPEPAQDHDAPAPVPDPMPEWSIADLLQGFRFENGDLPVLVARAAPMLNLAHALRTGDRTAPIGELRRELTQALRDYDAALSTAGILPDQARAAHYVVCATLDDVIRHTEWGQDWMMEGLVSTFHHDVHGGEKVFELLAHFQKTPRAARELLFLIYLCLSLGFEGRARVSPRGATELALVRENLYRTLRTEFQIEDRDLSPHWQGENAAHSRRQRSVLFWLVTGLGALMLVGAFLVLSLLLNRQAEATLARMATLPPDTVPSLFVPEPPAPEPAPDPVVEAPPPPDVPPPPPAIDTFIAFLQPEVEDGLVQLFREGDAVLVRVANSGAFAPGSATIEGDFVAIFDRIGQALAAEDFDITVIGHTDDRPINSAAFPSNEFLSTARANAVRDILQGYITSDRVEIEGRADTIPIGDNATEEGREMNRRTEILVREAGGAVPDSLIAPAGDPLAPGQFDAEDPS